MIYSDQIDITPDHWHHLLVSVELQTIATHGGEWSGSIAEFVDSAAKLYVALDDVNYTGWDAFSNWTEGDPNDVITDGAYEVAGTSPDRDTGAIASYSVSDLTIPCEGQPLGIPGTKGAVAKIHAVEMAELQIFTGVSLDPGEMRNRRAFIDADGLPVPAVETQRKDDAGNPIFDEAGNPVMDPPPAEKLLGKKPDVLLHGSGDWIAGRNTGPAKVPDPTVDPPVLIPDPPSAGADRQDRQLQARPQSERTAKPGGCAPPPAAAVTARMD